MSYHQHIPEVFSFWPGIKGRRSSKWQNRACHTTVCLCNGQTAQKPLYHCFRHMSEKLLSLLGKKMNQSLPKKIIKEMVEVWRGTWHIPEVFSFLLGIKGRRSSRWQNRSCHTTLCLYNRQTAQKPPYHLDTCAKKKNKKQKKYSFYRSPLPYT